MNRTITMNLSGIIFHIEEDAYDKLNKYLATIRSYFMDSDGKDEIMSDIESRIAEMLQEKVSTAKQAVLMTDVESVIALMGKPEDFAGDTDNSQQKKEENNSSAYASGKNNYKRRRVFRDGDEKKLGGVCAGIANYFDFDPIWLRGAFAISFFVFGTGFLLYLLLWIILPEAKTTAEKLEMHGEKVDVNNISKAVNEEFEDFKKRMKNFGDEVGSKENKDKIRSNAQKAADFAGDVFMNIIKIVGKTAAIFFVILSIILMVVLLGSVFGSTNVVHLNSFGDNSSFSLYDVIHNFFPIGTSPQLVIIGCLLFFGIPLLAVIYGAIKYLLGIKMQHKIVKYSFSILWACGLTIMIYVGIKVGNDFQDDASIRQQKELKQKDTLILSVKNLAKYLENDQRMHKSRNHYRIGRLKWDFMEKNNDEIYFNCPVTLQIVPSETDSFQLIEVRSACGIDKKEASFRAKNIKYNFTQSDSLIEFEPNFQMEQNDKWRSQELKLVLKVPENKVIYLSKGMEYLINNVINVSNTWDSDMVGRRWIMKKEGLTCIDCKGLDDEDTMTGPPSPPSPPNDKNKYFLQKTVTFK